MVERSGDRGLMPEVAGQLNDANARIPVHRRGEQQRGAVPTAIIHSNQFVGPPGSESSIAMTRRRSSGSTASSLNKGIATVTRTGSSSIRVSGCQPSRTGPTLPARCYRRIQLQGTPIRFDWLVPLAQLPEPGRAHRTHRYRRTERDPLGEVGLGEVGLVRGRHGTPGEDHHATISVRSSRRICRGCDGQVVPTGAGVRHRQHGLIQPRGWIGGYDLLEKRQRLARAPLLDEQSANAAGRPGSVPLPARVETPPRPRPDDEVRRTPPRD